MTADPPSPYHRFAHEVMATTFEILVDGGDSNYVRQASSEAFRELDCIEAKLNRFDETSDVSKINKASTGVPVAVSFDTFACLSMALFVSAETDGAFDVTSASRIRPEMEAEYPTLDTTEIPAVDSGFNFIDLSEETLSVTVRRPGLRVDLGGIGKGYALDCIAEKLEDWDVNRCLLIAGGSTILAMEPPALEQGWPIQFGSGKNSRQMNLRQCSFSGSGLSVKGEHIFDPRSGIPVAGLKRAWALAPTAALSDALSTAFMILDRPAIEAFHKKHDEIGWALELPDYAGIQQLSSQGLPDRV